MTPTRALELARGDVARQREPLDLLVFAQAARASGAAETRSRKRADSRHRLACTTAGSMHCSDAARAPSGQGALRRVVRAAVALTLLLVAGVAGAHKASDSYLQINAAPGALEVRWDIALRDLDVALDLDSDADGKLTWGEVRAAWPRIESYALQRLAIEGCPLAAVDRGLERRNDGAYAVLHLPRRARWQRRRGSPMGSSPTSTRRIAASPRCSAPGRTSR